jgi:sec-independent protein translocase protein TatA
MQTVAASAVMLALFNLGGGEIILALALVLILFGAKRLPELSRGLGRGIWEFRKATREVTDEIDEAASDAGRSVGGIYGKPAAEALTSDNQVAELYEPAALQNDLWPRRRWRVPGFRTLYRWARRLLHVICGVRDKM